MIEVKKNRQFYVREFKNGQTFEKDRIWNMKFKHVLVENCKFKNVSFFNCNFQYAHFKNCVFEDCVFGKCALEGAFFRDCTVKEHLEFQFCSLRKSGFANPDKALPLNLELIHFSECDVAGLYSGQFRLLSVTGLSNTLRTLYFCPEKDLVWFEEWRGSLVDLSERFKQETVKLSDYSPVLGYLWSVKNANDQS